MVAPTRLIAEETLAVHPAAPLLARQMLDRLPIARTRRKDVELMTSELVTNAVRHAGTPCRLDITSDEHGLRIAVRDLRPLPTPLLDGSHLMSRGVGLRVVATLAHEWGVVPHTDGKTVWALFPSR